MAGIGLEPVTTLSSLGQRFHPVVEPAATPDAVLKLQAAYTRAHQNAIEGSNYYNQLPEVIARGQIAQQQAAEATDPAAIEARQTILASAKAKAEYDAAALDSELALKAHQQYGGHPIFGADGKRDYDAEKESGANYLRAARLLDYSQKGIQGEWKAFADPKTGQPRQRFVNGYGEDITPQPEGKVNPTLKRYQDTYHNAFLELNSPPKYSKDTPGSFATPSETAPPPEPVITSPLGDSNAPEVIPASPVVASLSPFAPEATGVFPTVMAGTPAGLAPVVQDPSASGMIVPTIQDPSASGPIVTVAPSAAGGSQVTVEAKPAPGQQRVGLPMVEPSSVYQGEGIPAGPAPGAFTEPEKIASTFRSHPFYEPWATKGGTIGVFNSLVKDYEKVKPGAVTSQMDLNLAKRLIQLSASGGGGTVGSRGSPEDRVKNLEDATPILEQLYGLPAHVLKTHVFEEGTRNRLIQEGQRAIASLEGKARETVKTAAGQLTRAGVDPSTVLLPSELALLQSGAATSGSATRSKKVTVGGKTFNANW